MARQCLHVQDFLGLSEFYCDLLGMQQFGSVDLPLFGYGKNECLLEFHKGAVVPYKPNDLDLYWKLGITLRDLDHAVQFLRAHNLTVTDPRQFRDIGYMCHLTDPKGFTIELLQHGFEGYSKTVEPGHPIGTQATLAHITLRVTDISTARQYCEDLLGMRLMSIQPVDDLGFCLYFFAWSDEELPSAELQAVENREWLWSRPYTLLELQHVISTTGPVRIPDAKASGFAGFGSMDARSQTLSYLTPTQLSSFR